MGLHRVFNNALLFLCLFFQSVEFFPCLLLIYLLLLELSPYCRSFLDAIRTVICIVPLIHLKRLNQVSRDILHRFFNNLCKYINSWSYTCDSDRQGWKFKFACFSLFTCVRLRSHAGEHVSFEVRWAPSKPFREFLDQLVVADTKVLKAAKKRSAMFLILRNPA